MPAKHYANGVRSWAFLKPGQSWNATLQHVANAFNKNLVVPLLNEKTLTPEE